MKRILMLLAAFLLLTACGGRTAENPAEEAVPAEYGRVLELAQAEFEEVFQEFEDLEVLETLTAGWTGDPGRAVVQFRYTSGNGGGVYGFEYRRDGADMELTRQGTDVTPESVAQ